MENKDMRHCTQCGAPLQEDDRFCRKCGAKTGDGAVSDVQDRTETTVGGLNKVSGSAVQTTIENNSFIGTAARVRIKFPLAAIVYIVIALYGLMTLFQGRPSPMYPSMYMGAVKALGLLTFLSSVFMVTVLLLKKRGALLLAAVCVLAVVPVGNIAVNYQIHRMYMWSNNPIRILELLAYVCMIGLAVCCGIKKERTRMGAVPKLWFIPGALSALDIALQFPVLSTLLHGNVSLMLNFVFPSLLHIAAMFLLGYWISYIYSVKLPEGGGRQADRAAGSAPAPTVGGNSTYSGSAYVQDTSSTGFFVLSIFFPVVGLILYLVWREPLPLRAHSAGKGAIIGGIAYMALMILSVVVQVALTMWMLR